MIPEQYCLITDSSLRNASLNRKYSSVLLYSDLKLGISSLHTAGRKYPFFLVKQFSFFAFSLKELSTYAATLL